MDRYVYGIHTLDWEGFDESMRERRGRRRITQRNAIAMGPISGFEDMAPPSLMSPEIEVLPQPWEDQITSLEFGLTQHYQEEIQRHAKRAADEWDHPTHFDTSIREMCLGGAIAHVLIAFKLLADCVWNEAEQKTTIGSDIARISKYAMPYRFWLEQTGRGCVGPHAETDKLFEYQKSNDRFWRRNSATFIAFVNDLREAEGRNEIYYDEEDEPVRPTRMRWLRGLTKRITGRKSSVEDLEEAEDD